MNTIIGVLIPFIGTCLGSLCVYFMSHKKNKSLEIILLGFSAGVMMAASVWSLIIPSIDMTTKLSFVPAAIGLLLGILIFYFLDIYLKKKNMDINRMMLAVTIHNIPEGMAVGVIYASLIAGVPGITLASCLALSIGVGIQNIPEGSIVSMPMLKKGKSKFVAFMYGVLSAAFEVLGAIITIVFASIVVPVLPYFLSFAAGAMIYVVIVELIPESKSDNNLNVIGFIIGFIIMMILDVTLG